MEASTEEAKELSKRATVLLTRLGVPTHFTGYGYLHTAIRLVSTTRLIGHTALIKQVYADVAKTYSVSTVAVERCIRYAIAAAWSKGNETELRRLFPSFRKSRPEPNAYVITRLAEEIDSGG